jgi:hypothetical protein
MAAARFGVIPVKEARSIPPKPYFLFLHFPRLSGKTHILRWKVDRLLDDLAEIEPSAFLAVSSN